ncbi:MAG: dTMP kinase [Sphaerochaetaceae bacterium]|jgi:dTMP kinase
MIEVLKRFVVIEGLDGAGATTQMGSVTEAFDKSGVNCHATFEPTSSPLGSLVRSVLRKEIVTTPLALALLFSADREDHLYNPINGIVEKMEEGTVVISDRYLFSSLAYQAVECGFEKVRKLNKYPYPKFLFYLDTPVEDCIKRIELRDNGRELFEKEEFLTKVRDNYEVIFSALPEEVVFVRIDGTKSKEEITKIIVSKLKEFSLL